jgi:hypothetical protein
MFVPLRVYLLISWAYVPCFAVSVFVPPSYVVLTSWAYVPCSKHILVTEVNESDFRTRQFPSSQMCSWIVRTKLRLGSWCWWYINTIIEFLDIIHLIFYLKHFGDWILSPSSGKSLLSWADGQWIMSKNSIIGKLKAFKRLILTTCSSHRSSEGIASMHSKMDTLQKTVLICKIKHISVLYIDLSYTFWMAFIITTIIILEEVLLLQYH